MSNFNWFFFFSFLVFAILLLPEEGECSESLLTIVPTPQASNCLVSSFKTVDDTETACVCKAYEYKRTIKYSRWCDSTDNIYRTMINAKDQTFKTLQLYSEYVGIVKNQNVPYYGWGNYNVTETLGLDCKCVIYLERKETNHTPIQPPANIPQPAPSSSSSTSSFFNSGGIVHKMGDGLASQLALLLSIVSLLAITGCMAYSCRCLRNPTTTREEDIQNDPDSNLLASPSPISSSPPPPLVDLVSLEESKVTLEEDFIMLSSYNNTVIIPPPPPYSTEEGGDRPTNDFLKRGFDFIFGSAGSKAASENDNAGFTNSNLFATEKPFKISKPYDNDPRTITTTIKEGEYVEVDLNGSTIVYNDGRESTDTLTDVYNSLSNSDSDDPFSINTFK